MLGTIIASPDALLIRRWRPASVPALADDASSLEGDAMGRGDRRKCKCCRKLFRPAPRNRRHQRYCSAPVCRAASKAASQARWLAKPENQDDFRGPVNVARVQLWRSRHPGYGRGIRRTAAALQDPLLTQPVDSTAAKLDVAYSPLQEVLTAHPAVLIGLIAHIVGTPPAR